MGFKQIMREKVQLKFGKQTNVLKLKINIS